MSEYPSRIEEARIDNADLADWGCGKSDYVTADFAAELYSELTVANAEIAELRAAFDRQRDNYTQLYEAVIGDGTMVQCDPVAVAKELRAKCERLEHAGDALAEFLAPGPIPAESPTRVDYALGDWEFAKANPGGAHE